MRGRRRPAPPPGERQDYLASVSDLMSGLIFIFIITLAVFSFRLAEAQEKAASRERMLEETRNELLSADKVRQAVLMMIQDDLRQEGIDVEVDLEHGILRLTEKAIHFDTGVAEPRPEHLRHVGILANVLLRVLRCHVSAVQSRDSPSRDARPSQCVQGDSMLKSYACEAGVGGPRVDTVLIEGHTDSVPIGPGFIFKDNLELSAARSANVLRTMLACESELEGLLNESGERVLSVSGFGDTRPALREDPNAASNRRIDLRFLMALPRGSGSAEGAAEPVPVQETRRELER
jgi:flagellar motor protein MotB